METSVDSREYRVVFFCPTSSAQLEHIEAPVRRVLTRISAPPAELAPLDAAGSLGEAGWRVYLVRSMTERSAAHALAAHVTEAAAAISTELDTEVLGPDRVRVLLESGGLRSALSVHLVGDSCYVDGPEGSSTFAEQPRFPDCNCMRSSHHAPHASFAASSAPTPRR